MLASSSAAPKELSRTGGPDSSVGEGYDSDLGRVLFDHRRRRLKRDGAVPIDDRDDDDEVEVESVIEGTQLGRGKTES